MLKGSQVTPLLLVYRSPFEWKDSSTRDRQLGRGQEICTRTPTPRSATKLPRDFGEVTPPLKFLDFSSIKWGWDAGLDQRRQLLNTCDCFSRCCGETGRPWRRDGHDFQSSRQENSGGICRKALVNCKLSHLANCDPVTFSHGSDCQSS